MTNRIHPDPEPRTTLSVLLCSCQVTQRFFETVSVQLERWYERKVAQVEQQTELSARQDKRELLQRINALEEELERLKTNENSDS